ncbi:HK97 family phage prohead protease [Rickettsiales endosymbiont of Stachyamoeba lipophora]|uniref:HK97 family phage prohead protease n=1 Tax=Rickettsiales endosymbiont of Stachyamoeba lipophora TaxID=2486578 RepID=UPI000F6525EE|nr:HK97 family phage prohead protease [Rickettsiales endosymbiont of Stachyamoeba lipophora]AZL15556.1 HK97 family phage prohead protease [Rickettsiales endosymbiont of Stachyamoeba lipophora]
MKDLNLSWELKSIKPNGFFSGYASVFNITDLHGDIIQSGAFLESLKRKQPSEIKLLWQHKTDEPIGIINSLYENEFGLCINARLLLELKRAQEAYTLMQHNVLGGMSIGYQVKKYSYNPKLKQRIITELDLLEISLVTFPANPQCKITNLKQAKSTVLTDSIKHAINILKQQ